MPPTHLSWSAYLLPLAAPDPFRAPVPCVPAASVDPYSSSPGGSPAPRGQHSPNVLLCWKWGISYHEGYISLCSHYGNAFMRGEEPNLLEYPLFDDWGCSLNSIIIEVFRTATKTVQIIQTPAKLLDSVGFALSSTLGALSTSFGGR